MLRCTIASLALALFLCAPPASLAQSNYHTLYKFTGGSDGAGGGQLVADRAGNLYGPVGTADYHGSIFKLTPQPSGSWSESIIYTFKRAEVGSNPLILDGVGNLYGTTYSGGTGSGSVFELTPRPSGMWSMKVLYEFCSQKHCIDGGLPRSGMIFDEAGNLYGTTMFGGGSGCGVVFQLSPNGDGSWTETVLHTFDRIDGAEPFGGLTFDRSGNLYGTTTSGGAYNYGTVFELVAGPDGTWTENLLHDFEGSDGAGPGATLAIDSFGNFYGTTESGGKGCNGIGCGVVFELSPGTAGWNEETLFRFNGADGVGPYTGVVLDLAGNLWGSTFGGGNGHCLGGGCGVVFKLIIPASAGAWHETVVHTFADDPGSSGSGLIVGQSGAFYGTTVGDQTTTFGSVFEINP
jgi:uncharacterized repeat protein (TIGR03803 family)